ncbi:MAG TPA: hypothetical protein VNF93_02300 [Buchnera sp. (in: enterobacteria)]|nr:hypothetical protein [Buchnera sp. (in: enterobacteria)]
MAFSMIPLPQYENPSDKTLKTMLGITSVSSDIADQLEKYKQIQIANQLAQSQEERVNKLFPEQLKKAQMENQLYIPKTQSDINYKNANTNRLNFQQQNPLYGQSGAAGQIGAAELLRQHPELISDPNAANQIMNALNLSQQSKNIENQYKTKQTQNYDWGQLTAEEQNNLLAQGRGMGIDPIKMKDYINNGYGLRKIAEKEGLDPDNLPRPRFSPTTATKTRTQLVDQVNAELDYLSSSTTPIIKKYANTYAGFSPKRIIDQLSNDPRKQKEFGEYVGALSAMSGIANARNLLEGGQPGVTVMNDIRDNMLKGIDTHAGQKMTGVAFQAAQDKINEILSKGAKIRTSTGMNPYEDISNKNKKSQESVKGSILKEAEKFKGENIVMQGPDGNLYQVPTGKAQLFLKNGYKRQG